MQRTRPPAAARRKAMAVLTTTARKRLPTRAFAIPKKAPGSGSYPIPDAAHARNALSRVAQHGTPEEKARVRAAVRRKFPGIGRKTKGGREIPL